MAQPKQKGEGGIDISQLKRKTVKMMIPINELTGESNGDFFLSTGRIAAAIVNDLPADAAVDVEMSAAFVGFRNLSRDGATGKVGRNQGYFVRRGRGFRPPDRRQPRHHE